MGNKNTKDKMLSKFGLITAIVFGIIFILDVLFTALMAVGCIVSLMDGTADLGVSIAVMSVLIIICLFFGVVSVVGVIIFAVTNKKNKKGCVETLSSTQPLYYRHRFKGCSIN